MAGEKRTFTYAQALEVFPTVRDLTTAAVRQVEALYAQINSREELEEQREEVEAAYQAIVEKWAEHVTSLGCEVKGLWLVDWDNGEGYYCWRYPEDSLGYFHGYDEGFAGRVPVA